MVVKKAITLASVIEILLVRGSIIFKNQYSKAMNAVVLGFDDSVVLHNSVNLFAIEAVIVAIFSQRDVENGARADKAGDLKLVKH